MDNDELQKHINIAISMLEMIRDNSVFNTTEVNNDALQNTTTFVCNIIVNNDGEKSLKK